MEKQKTIQRKVSVSGVGLHTGKPVTLSFLPAPPHHWFKFQRIDLPHQPTISADVDYVIGTERGTTLGLTDEQGRIKDHAVVHTTEHVLAALIGMNLDNVLIQVDGPEIPIMDGSSKPFVEALQEAGIEEQDAERVYFELKENLTYECPERKIEMLAVPQETFRITVMVDYDSEILGTQHASMYHIGEFVPHISMCRTFVFLHELEVLLQHNLIKGGDLDNAIVLVDRELPKEKIDYLKKVFHKEHVEVKGKGVLNNTKLHFYNEPARHKLLDIVGDLALVGQHMKIHVLAARPGHYGNTVFAKKIKEVIKKQKKEQYVPKINSNTPILMDVREIQKILPHRPPFLFVDRIIELTPEYVIGIRNVTINDYWFVGHFPDEPVMPGVLIIEALAQTGGILALKSVPDPENYQTYFLKIDHAKFKQKVVPGDTLVMRMDLVEPIRRGICHMIGRAFVGNKLVCEADMMAQIVKVRNIQQPVKTVQI